MRAVLQRLEKGDTIAELAELQASLAPGELEALRAASIVRDTGVEGVVELSLGDLIRALRVLYGAKGHGIVAWSTIQPTPMAVGIMEEEAGRRDLVLVSGPRHGFQIIAMRKSATLALAFTADHLTRAAREAMGPGGPVQIEVLEETLHARRNRLARRGSSASLPDPALAPAPSSAPAPAAEPAPATPPGPKYPGATSWSEVRIRAEDWTTVRIEHGPNISRATAWDLGMAHRTTRKPTILWHALQAVCDGHGTYRGRRLGNAGATSKTMSRLALTLRELFGLDESPLFPFSDGLGWSTRFVADDRVSEEARRVSPEEREAMRERAELDEVLNDFQHDAGGRDVDEDGPVDAARKWTTR